MIIGFGKEFHTTSFSQAAEGIDHIRTVPMQLFNASSGNGIRDFKPSFVFLNQLVHHGIGWQVAQIRNPVQDLNILCSCLVCMIFSDLEEAVIFEPVRLMYLKIKANRGHNGIGFPCGAQC